MRIEIVMTHELCKHQQENKELSDGRMVTARNLGAILAELRKLAAAAAAERVATAVATG